uniref:Uncharacterized protein n=1 Tax=Ditylenchus dipsaci TaxID=166011 RepID=A0A915CNZ6_9BILA
MPKIPESVHNSLSSLNSSIASSLRVLLTGSRQKNEHQHDYIEILEVTIICSKPEKRQLATKSTRWLPNEQFQSTRR